MKVFAVLAPIILALLVVACGSSNNVEVSTLPVTVNYDLSVEEALADEYDVVHSDITSPDFIHLSVSENFQGTNTLEIHLIHFDRVLTTDELVDEFNERGWRPAILIELLAFGEQYPDLQREFPIIAAGSLFQDSVGGLNVPLLWGNNQQRTVDLFWSMPSWESSYRFAAVSK